MPGLVLVALSGGADSIWAAWRLRQDGYEVLGVHFRLDPFRSGAQRPISWGEVAVDGKPENEFEQRLARIAKAMGADLVFLQLGSLFRQKVVEPFVQEYKSGRTPNPCVFCNALIKFAGLRWLAARLNTDYYATGHYARIVRHAKQGVPLIARAADRARDQSYFLCRVGPDLLKKALLPLGEAAKEEVRDQVDSLGLCGKLPKPSRDICFVGPKKYTKVLTALGGSAKPGPIVDLKRGTVGYHSGIINFTIGQRRGLAVAMGRRRYVVGIDPATRTVYVGDRSSLLKAELTASDVVWAARPEWPAEASLTVQIRSRHKGGLAKVIPLERNGRRVRVIFEQKQPAVTPGQAAAFYEGDVLVGGGWID